MSKKCVKVVHTRNMHIFAQGASICMSRVCTFCKGCLVGTSPCMSSVPTSFCKGLPCRHCLNAWGAWPIVPPCSHGPVSRNYYPANLIFSKTSNAGGTSPQCMYVFVFQYCRLLLRLHICCMMWRGYLYLYLCLCSYSVCICIVDCYFGGPWSN